MARIGKKTVQTGPVVPAKNIPDGATHVSWFAWDTGRYVLQYADTQRSAKIAYGQAQRQVGVQFPWGKVTQAGWTAIEPADLKNGLVL